MPVQVRNGYTVIRSTSCSTAQASSPATAQCKPFHSIFDSRELTAASRRFDDFVRELAHFNELFGDH